MPERPSLRPTDPPGAKRKAGVASVVVAIIPECVALLCVTALAMASLVDADQVMPVVWIVLGVRLGLLRKNGAPPRQGGIGSLL